METHVGAHASDEYDRASALRDHVARGLPRREESSMNVDIVQFFNAVEWVAKERRISLGDATVSKWRTQRPSSFRRYLKDIRIMRV
jgi:hypothetical protein